MTLQSTRPPNIHRIGAGSVSAHDSLWLTVTPRFSQRNPIPEGPTYESGVRHQIAFMCDDIHGTVAELRARGIQIDGEPKRRATASP